MLALLLRMPEELHLGMTLWPHGRHRGPPPLPPWWTRLEDAGSAGPDGQGCTTPGGRAVSLLSPPTLGGGAHGPEKHNSVEEVCPSAENL